MNLQEFKDLIKSANNKSSVFTDFTILQNIKFRSWGRINLKCWWGIWKNIKIEQYMNKKGENNDSNYLNNSSSIFNSIKKDIFKEKSSIWLL